MRDGEQEWRYDYWKGACPLCLQHKHYVEVLTAAVMKCCGFWDIDFNGLHIIAFQKTEFFTV
jgi:hypothetical protein